MYRYTLRDVLQLYLYTRRWQREQEAMQYDLLQLRVGYEAAISGHYSREEVARLVRPLQELAAAQRRPEWEPPLEERIGPVGEGTRQWIAASRAASSTELDGG